MTDKELVQALRHCASGDEYGCLRCPGEATCDECSGKTVLDAADRLEALLAENAEMSIQIQKEICKRVDVEAENERLKAGKDTDAPTKWVSVEERLPEMHTEQIHDSDGAVYSFVVSDRVLVKPRNGEIAIAQYEVSDEGRAMWEDDSGRAFEVTHWMPLPSTEGVE